MLVVKKYLGLRLCDIILSYQQSWNDSEHLIIILPNLERYLTDWNKNTFDNILKKKKDIFNRLNAIQKFPN